MPGVRAREVCFSASRTAPEYGYHSAARGTAERHDASAAIIDGSASDGSADDGSASDGDGARAADDRSPSVFGSGSSQPDRLIKFLLGEFTFAFMSAATADPFAIIMLACGLEDRETRRPR